MMGPAGPFGGTICEQFSYCEQKASAREHHKCVVGKDRAHPALPTHSFCPPNDGRASHGLPE